MQLNRLPPSVSLATASSSTSINHWNNNNLKTSKNCKMTFGDGRHRNNETDNLNSSVCSNCKVLVTSSVSSKSEVDEMECHVRYLQRGILKALQMLDRLLERFYGDVQKIVEVIHSSDSNCLEEEVQISKKDATRRISQRPLLEDALSFRDTILSVFTKMKRFRTENSVNKLEKSRNVPRKVVVSKATVCTVVKKKIGKDTNDDQLLQENNLEPVPLTDQDDEGSTVYDEHNLSDYDENNRSSSSDSSHKHPTLAQRRSKRKRQTPIFQARPSSKRPATYDLASLKDKPRTYLGKRFSDTFELVTSEMSQFKANIVKRTFNKTKRKPRRGDEGPLAYHYVTYDPNKDTISVDNKIPIKFNEIDQLLECSLCQYSCRDVVETSTNKNLAEKKMMYHILGKHMHVFRCDPCDISFGSYTQYVKHQQIHKHAPGGAIPNCEICGKQLSSIWNYEDHKWIHMTPEEKEQAKRDGKKDPAERHRKYPKIHQCFQCGKSFKKPYMLKKHLLVHASKREEDFMCAGCGKVFKAKGNLTAHQKKTCVQLKKDTA